MEATGALSGSTASTTSRNRYRTTTDPASAQTRASTVCRRHTARSSSRRPPAARRSPERRSCEAVCGACPSTAPPTLTALVPYDQVRARGEQQDAQDALDRDRLLLHAEDAQLVDDERDGELPGDGRRGHAARPQRAHGDEDRGHVGGAEQAAHEVVPGQPARLA